MRPRLLAGRAAAFLSICVLPFAACDGNVSLTRTTGEIGSGGGSLTVTSGPLAGTVFTVPASALPDGTAIAIDEGATPILVGFETVGPGTSIEAASATLAADASARLLFDPTLMPMGTTVADVRVIRQTSRGRRVTLMPASVDMTNGFVQVAVAEFGQYWVVAEAFDVRFVLATYFPLIDGDAYVYDNGLTLAVENVFDEPNLEGFFISRVTLGDGIEDRGLYLARDLGETLLFGEFSVSANFQLVGVPALDLMPETGDIGDTFVDTGTFVHYDYLDPGFARDVVEVRSRVSIASQGRLTTPAGTFENVLEVVVELDRTSSDLVTVTSTADRWFLARGIGPVRVDLGGIGATLRGSLVSGVVAGEAIVPE